MSHYTHHIDDSGKKEMRLHRVFLSRPVQKVEQGRGLLGCLLFNGVTRAAEGTQIGVKVCVSIMRKIAHWKNVVHARCLRRLASLTFAVGAIHRIATRLSPATLIGMAASTFPNRTILTLQIVRPPGPRTRCATEVVFIFIVAQALGGVFSAPIAGPRYPIARGGNEVIILSALTTFKRTVFPAPLVWSRDDFITCFAPTLFGFAPAILTVTIDRAKTLRVFSRPRIERIKRFFAFSAFVNHVLLFHCLILPRKSVDPHPEYVSLWLTYGSNAMETA